MPARIFHVGIFSVEQFHNPVNLIFNLITVHHRILTVMIVRMPRRLRMMVDKRSLIRIFIVMSYGMHQDLQTALLPCGHRDGRDTKHLRQTVQVNLHTPLLYNIHHIKRQHYRLSKLNEL